ncbi:polysaccharide deacetylase family protein [Streptomyces calidiresistens]|uniref:polysaccharide deacetylase family protein n=1 Tax=Streptomyces calidiresistens TaxID=1485586 RepID=UPI002B20754C|nr:polysaccharide deacetylase family protein [Streptomyces calidiresistens]
MRRCPARDATRATSEELATGDTLEISGEDYEVIGIATPDSGEAGAEVYLPLDVAQELAGGDPVISTVYVRVTDSRLIGEVADAVTANIADTEVTTASELAETVSGSLGTAAGLAEGVGRWLSVIVLVVAFGVAGLLAAGAVGRRVREFGTLKALGWSRGRVTRQVTAESMATGLVGGALGLPAGLLGARAISSLAPSLTAEWGAGSLPGAGGLDRITGGFSGGPGGGGDASRLRPFAGGAGPPAPRGAVPVREAARLTLPANGARRIALTFDDGPHPEWTPRILETLRRYRTPATFFVIGENVRAHPDLLREVAADGHLIANHSWSHPRLDHLPRSRVREELERTCDLLAGVLGAPPHWARAPYGAWHPPSLEVCAELGMEPLGWSIDTEDWTRPGSSAISRAVLDGAHPGGIVLAHDGGGDRSQSASALDHYLPRLLDRGWTMVRPV